MLELSLVVGMTLFYIKKSSYKNRTYKTRFFCGTVLFAAVVKLALTAIYLGKVFDFFEMALGIAFAFVSVITVWGTIQLLENMREKLYMENELQTAERLNVIGHMAASVAHEIRNPLTVIRGFLQIFLQDIYVPDQKKSHLKMMIKELDRAETMITDYLSLAKPQTDKMQYIDMRDRITFVVDIINAFATLHNIRLLVDVEPNLIVQADAEKLNQVLINIIKNAIEASENGGTVNIAARKIQNYIEVKIIDYGIGLSKEQLERLGSPFYSTKEKGTGLGLMVCVRIIEGLGGKLEVKSEQGTGSTFTILLPAASK